MKVPTYGVIQTRQLRDEMDSFIEKLEVKGFVVLERCVANELLNRVSSAYDRLMQLEESNADKFQSGFDKDQNIIRCPLAHEDVFLEIACIDKPIGIIKRMLGENIVLLMQNAIRSVQGREQYQAQWHRDLNYQHFVSSRPLALNFLLAVDEFTKENGATMVLPGSHMFEQFPSDAYVLENQISLEAPAGSVIILNAMTFHRTGDHFLSSKVRRAVNHVVGMPFMAQQIDLPRYLKSVRDIDYSSDPFLEKYLGYKWNPAANVLEWRSKR